MPMRLAALLAIFLANVASVASTTGATTLAADPRLNRSEQEAAAEAATEAKQKMAAVDKALSLLEKLKDQVFEEGEIEAASYNKFACFCKERTAEKLGAVKKNEDEKTDLVAEIQQLSSKRDSLDESIKNAGDAITSAEKAMKGATKERSKTKGLYEINSADLKQALFALEGAIKMLKSSKSPSFAQLRSVSKTVSTAFTLADALGLGSGAPKRATTAFFQQVLDSDEAAPANEVPMEDYKYHSDDIISMLDDELYPRFRQAKVDIDKEEVESIKSHESFMQEKAHEIKTLKHKVEQAKKDKEGTIADIESSNQRLSTFETVVLDDKEYVNKLSQMCTDKAKTWDQRVKTRSAELQTLTQAIGIIKGAVSEKTTAATIRFAQQSASIRYAKTVASNPADMDAIESAAEDFEAAPSFLQQGAAGSALASVRRLRGAPLGDEAANERGLVATLLRSRGAELKSTLLTALASKISADPLAKVKQLIQELIERLMQEAANESNQKGWCDKATAEAKQKREYASEEILALNGQMAELEAARDQLKEELSELAKEIKEVKAAQKVAEQERQQEKQQNEATIDEARQGLSALDMCIDLLDKFYKTIKKESVDLSLAQQSPEEEAPDAGFDNGEAYTGSQSEAGGILGMLDVMKSDFTRTISETQVEEKKAEQDHLAFMAESGTSLATKEAATSEKSQELEDRESKYGEASGDLDAQTGILKTSIKELQELKPACVDTGMSYEERVARREDEVAALNKGLCILERYADYGPEGAADGC